MRDVRHIGAGWFGVFHSQRPEWPGGSRGRMEPPGTARRMETEMNYLLYPFVIVIAMFAAILSASTATL